MIGSALVAITLALAGADDGSDAARWIDRLGAEAFDDRVAAYKAIERMGPSALPALNAAADAADPRVRSRVRALIATIGRQAETDRFARPTLIRLDFHERPLGAVIDALNERHDLALSLRLGPAPRRGMVMFDPEQPKRLQAMRDRAVTVEAAEPLPYWEVIDRLCQAASLHYDASPQAGFGSSQGALVLMAGEAARGAVSDSGPFRVQITDVRAVFERDFVQEPNAPRKGANAPDGGDLTVALAVLPEPGLALHPNGLVAVAEAVDDQGRSLVLPAPKPADGPNSPRAVSFTRSPSIHVEAKLLAPDPPGTKIRRLRGSVPVAVVAKRSDPIVVQLKEVGTAKSIETPDMTLIIDEVSLVPGAQAPVRVTIRPKRSAGLAGRRPDRRPPNFAAFDRDRVLERFEFRDAAGKRLGLSTNGQTRGADAQGFYDRYQLTATLPGDSGPRGRANAGNAPVPSELRYYELVQTITEIPFDFHDVPMP